MKDVITTMPQSIYRLFCLLSIFILVSTPASAQSYLETRDTGEFPATAQVIPGGTLEISGTLNDARDVDMYRIEVTNGDFTATTVGGTTVNTTLWMFDADSMVVTLDFDDPICNCPQSTIVPGTLPGTGMYYLAVVAFDNSPFDSTGFSISPGPGRGPMLGWTEAVDTTTTAGSYTIYLTQQQVSEPTAGEDVGVPGSYELSTAYPNPFNPSTQFNLTVEQSQMVRIEIFDATGRLVETLHNGLLAGNTMYRFTFEAHDLPSGLYLYRATGTHFRASRQMTLLK